MENADAIAREILDAENGPGLYEDLAYQHADKLARACIERGELLRECRAYIIGARAAVILHSDGDGERESSDILAKLDAQIGGGE